ncbi:MAG: ribosomal-processing cysteine protease Prp [Erysipelotrichaceae bacterium]|nr:ribosomal-processing cysteine protease Prp [Erysipelotrichaceae bacterium]
MIKVRYTEANDRITHIRVLGHANAGPYGEDLVCAGVSAIVYGALNSLQEEDAYDINLDEGYVQIFLVGEGNRHDDIVLEVMLTSLKTIAESEPDYVSLQPFSKYEEDEQDEI